MGCFSGKDLVCVRSERIVFARLGFAVSDGGALVLVGPNGSGKSSLLRVMAGFIRPVQGDLLWDGAALSDDFDAHRARLCYVGHHDAVKPVLSVAENLAFWAELTGNGAASVIDALNVFGIGRLADVPGRFLSAGQKRRVNLARILVTPSPIWLLDEPTTALDAAAIEALQGAIAAHRAGGGMVIVSTHSDLGLDGVDTLNLGDFTVKNGGFL